MGYDISFRVKVDGIDKYVVVGDCEANTTWNVREMIVKSTGLEWKNEASNGFCKDIIPHIEKGHLELIHHPEKYKKYEAKNGWGTVDSTIQFFNDIITAWQRFERYEDKELADVAVFWID